MITRNVPPLNPASSKWYYITWSEDELGTGVTIVGSDWGAISDGAFAATVPALVTEDAAYLDALTTGVRLSVTAAGEGEEPTTTGTVEVVNQITTSAGETLHETLRITINATGH